MNILLVDDVRLNLEILRKMLDEQYTIFCANNGEEAIEIMLNENVDLVLLDIMMPGLNGYEVCDFITKNKKTAHIPVIFVTSKVDEESILKGYEMGGVDYVTKPYKKLELLAKIKTHLKLKNLIEELEFIATHDTMTGAYNRRQFFKLAIEKFQKENDIYGVMIDIDKFKKINDNYGHKVGDIVIKTFVKVAKETIKGIFGRLGGEEFGLICDKEEIENIKELRKKIENLTIKTDDNREVKFTISIGIAKKGNHKNIDELLHDADLNLYDAKGSGRNKIVFRKRCIS